MEKGVWAVSWECLWASERGWVGGGGQGRLGGSRRGPGGGSRRAVPQPPSAHQPSARHWSGAEQRGGPEDARGLTSGPSMLGGAAWGQGAGGQGPHCPLTGTLEKPPMRPLTLLSPAQCPGQATCPRGVSQAGHSAAPSTGVCYNATRSTAHRATRALSQLALLILHFGSNFLVQWLKFLFRKRDNYSATV